MTNHKENEDQTGDNKKSVSRRNFLKVTGTIVMVAGTGHIFACTSEKSKISNQGPQNIKFPPSDGYLIVDTKKCQGCVSCMLACSIVHEGVESLSLSRIQIIENSFNAFPDDLTIEQCRQCVNPVCVKECPEEALTINKIHGNVRMVDPEKCIGCGTCFDVCPYKPSRLVVAADEKFDGNLKARKCDLCAAAPYHWNKAGGGPDGKQACVEICPVGAIQFTKKIPDQNGIKSYKVNLRKKNWRKLGYPSS